MDTRSFLMPSGNHSMIEEKLAKLNKRATKLGLDPIVLTWGKAMLNDKQEMFLPCELTGPLTVSYDGWEFVATLQHLPTGENIIRAIAHDFDIPTEYRASGSACEHCKVKRYRKDTYLVYSEEKSEVLQVGSTCIKDFLGGNSPDNIMQRASFVGELLAFMEGASHGSPQGHDEGIFHIVSFLAQTSACIRDYGWLSKGQAYKDGGTSTAVRVQDNLTSGTDFKRSLITAEDKQLAKEAADWAENLTDEEVEPSDYLYNIRAIARSGMVGYRTMGFAASILNAYERDNLVQTPKKESDFIGTLKKREIFDLKVKKVTGFTGPYGYTNKYIFEDSFGNIVVWLTSVPAELEEGKKYAIKGTVKEHLEFKGSRQTSISRCEVLTHY
jgi:hypothetical protein